MPNKFIFIPVLVQVFLTIYAYLLLKSEKTKAVAAGLVDEKRRALYEDAWPESVIKINNNIKNQFQVPVLFYVMIFITWELEAVNLVAMVLATLFALSRILHTLVHTRENYIPYRTKLFSFGVATVIGLFFNVVYALFI